MALSFKISYKCWVFIPLSFHLCVLEGPFFSTEYARLQLKIIPKGKEVGLFPWRSPNKTTMSLYSRIR